MLKRYFAEIASQLARTLAFITNSQRESKDNRRKSRLHHRRDGSVVHEGRALWGPVLAVCGKQRDGQGSDERRKGERGDGAKNVQGRNEKCDERGKGKGGRSWRRNAIFPFGAFSSDRGTTCARLSDF